MTEIEIELDIDVLTAEELEALLSESLEITSFPWLGLGIAHNILKLHTANVLSIMLT